MMKEQSRPMPIPTAAPTAASDKSIHQQQAASLGMEQASEEEVMQAKGIVENVVSYIYSDGAPDILQQMAGATPRELGEIAGNLVTNEIALEEEAGQDISRDIEAEIMAEVILELVDLGMHEGVLNLPDEESEQAFMGEALTYALGAAMDSDDPEVTNESMMNIVTNMIGASEQAQQPSNGIPVHQEVANGSELG